MKTINISRNQYISDIEPFKSSGIPTNSRIPKTITGCGITTFEISFAKHHSIIILPNVPVIKGKVANHNAKYPDAEILGVHKGIDVDDIKAYLLKKVKYKKILTTPEGFATKVLKAFADNMEHLTEDYFLLLDEAERIVTDVSYRGMITAPLDTFFNFKNKAIVSATLLPFSDQRFANFETYIIKPDYDFSVPLQVINTNNVISSIKHHLDKIKSDHVCIFFNSTRGISAVIDSLKIKDRSKAYCSEDSVVKLMIEGFKNASSNFDPKEMNQYSFFTSRYFSAVDMLVDYKPDVILVSDIYYADHSILDPHTEIIQIAGRFRNGVNSITHITNFNSLMPTKTPEEAVTYLNGCLDTYQDIVNRCEKSKEKAAKDTLQFFVENSPIANFFANGKRNSFMIDNDINQERVKNYYLNSENLKNAYEEITNHFSTSYINEDYRVGDGDLFTLSKLQSKREKYKQVAFLIDRYTAKPNGFIFLSDAASEQKNILGSKYPLIAKALKLLGLEGLEKTDYDTININRAIRAAEKSSEIIRLTPFVQAAFSEHSEPNEAEIKSTIENVYKTKGSKLKVSATHIKRYFNAKRSTKGGTNVYVIKEKYNIDSIDRNSKNT